MGVTFPLALGGGQPVAQVQMIPVVSPANPRTPVLSCVDGVATNTTADVLEGDAPGGMEAGDPASLPMTRV